MTLVSSGGVLTQLTMVMRRRNSRGFGVEVGVVLCDGWNDGCGRWSRGWGEGNVDGAGPDMVWTMGAFDLDEVTS